MKKIHTLLIALMATATVASADEGSHVWKVKFSQVRPAKGVETTVLLGKGRGKIDLPQGWKCVYTEESADSPPSRYLVCGLCRGCGLVQIPVECPGVASFTLLTPPGEDREDSTIAVVFGCEGTH